MALGGLPRLSSKGPPGTSHPFTGPGMHEMNKTSSTLATAPAWRPTLERIERSNLTHFAAWVERRTGVPVTESYDRLWQWSVNDIEGFWLAIWQFFDVRADGAPRPVLQKRSMPGAHWFPYVRLNYAEHVFRDRDPSDLAIQFSSERAGVGFWTWERLENETARIAAGLRRLGVGRGDRVA